MECTLPLVVETTLQQTQVDQQPTTIENNGLSAGKDLREKQLRQGQYHRWHILRHLSNNAEIRQSATCKRQLAFASRRHFSSKGLVVSPWCVFTYLKWPTSTANYTLLSINNVPSSHQRSPFISHGKYLSGAAQLQQRSCQGHFVRGAQSITACCFVL